MATYSYHFRNFLRLKHFLPHAKRSSYFPMGDPLLQAAIQLGAPFVQEAVNRIRGEVFGHGRATRSTDVVIFNQSPYKFTLVKNSHSSGGWSNDLMPPHDILPKSSVVYGCESSGAATGCTDCKVHYRMENH